MSLVCACAVLSVPSFDTFQTWRLGLVQFMPMTAKVDAEQHRLRFMLAGRKRIRSHRKRHAQNPACWAGMRSKSGTADKGVAIPAHHGVVLRSRLVWSRVAHVAP